MAIRDVEAQNASLDNDYGPHHGDRSPDAHELALFAGDPMFDGVEISSAGGYAPAPVSNDADWPDADDGTKQRTITFAAPTGAWDPFDHWALRDPDTGTVWDNGATTEEVNITGASTAGPMVTVQIFGSDFRTTDL